MTSNWCEPKNSKNVQRLMTSISHKFKNSRSLFWIVTGDVLSSSAYSGNIYCPTSIGFFFHCPLAKKAINFVKKLKAIWKKKRT